MTARAETVTILFTDLVGSTELLQRAGDDDAQRIFKAHHLLLRDVVARHGGHEVKWLGDGLMVAFDSAADGVRAAIEMQQASRRPAAGERLHIRAGLNVGEALRDESDYFGSAVVIARRLCDSGGAGEIRASDLVARLLEERREFSFQDLGEVSLKGITKAVRAWHVSYEHDPLAMLSQTPFVGRAEVIASLTAGLESARAGKGSLVMLVGEPGIGKTRVLDEFAAQSASSGALVLRGLCYDGEWAPPFSPFVEAIRQYASGAETDGLDRAFGGDALVLARIVPLLRERLPGVPEPPAVPEETERYRLLEAVGNALVRLSETRPLVLMLDDLHWADHGTIAMLRHVARQAPEERLLVIGAYRDVELARQHPLADALQSLRRETNYERLVLKGLDAEDVEALLSVVAEQQVPETFVRAISEETGGNPFFIREVMLHLIEEGKIVQQDGRWAASAPLAEMRIPEGVREVIGRRLSRVSESCNRVLSVASALTGAISWEVMSALLDLGDAALVDALEEALNAQLIVERDRGTYEFAHALIRHTLYEELSTPRRALFHRQIGDALERVYTEHLHAHAAELAHHFDSTIGCEEKAIDYLILAGDAATRALAYESAMRQYSRAAELLKATPRRDDRRYIELLIQAARSRHAFGMASTDIFVQIAEVARNCRAFDLMTRAILRDPPVEDHRDSRICLWPISHERFTPLLEEAIAALPDEPSALLACALAYRAFLLSDTAAESERISRQAEDMARSLRNEHVIAYVLYWRMFLLTNDPRRRNEQLQAANEILEIALSLGDRPMERAGHMWKSFVLIALGDPSMDVELDAFHAMSHEFHQRQGVWWSSVCIAMRTLMRGDLQEAERLIIAAVQLWADLPEEDNDAEIGGSVDRRGTFAQQMFLLRFTQGRLGELRVPAQSVVQENPEVAAWRAALALVLYEVNQTDDARREYERALQLGLASAVGTFLEEATLALLSEVCAFLEDTAGAEDLFQRLAPYEGQMLNVRWRIALGAADRHLARLATTLGKYDEAVGYFDRALDLQARMGARPWVAWTHRDYARMLLRRDAPGDRDRARQLASAALQLAKEIGMAKVAADAEEMLAGAPAERGV